MLYRRVRKFNSAEEAKTPAFAGAGVDGPRKAGHDDFGLRRGSARR